jgi:hypothetical protein
MLELSREAIVSLTAAAAVVVIAIYGGASVMAFRASVYAVVFAMHVASKGHPRDHRGTNALSL